MSHEHEIDVDHHVRIYLRVFAALMVLTVITVAVARLDFTHSVAVALALLIATIKGSLVACYFMHLVSERKMIYFVMGLTVFFFMFCLLVPIITESNTFGALVGGG